MALEYSTQASFQETHWSVVLAAGKAESPRASAALEKLCQSYWPPLYAFIRRSGHGPAEAQDLTQEFFAHILQRNDLARTSPEKGRFRSFLLTALKHFLINQWHQNQCQKRGGGQPVFSLDAEPVEAQYQLEAVNQVTPETVYEKQWAMAVLDQTMNRLARDYENGGKADVFELLKETLTGGRLAVTRADIAARCGVSVGAVDVAVHRLRRRYGELLREEIAHTVSRPEDVEDEIRHLKAVLARG